MKKFIIFILINLSLYAQSPLFEQDPLLRPNAYTIIQLDNELFMVHMVPEMPSGSNYRIYNFPATINTSGLFQLASDVTHSITIAADNVVLDMQGHKVTGLISGSGRDNVTVCNGTIDGDGGINAILFNENSTNIVLKNVSVENAIEGINLGAVHASVVQNCVATNNTTGIGLYGCDNVLVDNCQVIGNSQDGIELWATSTSCVRDCNILATGSPDTIQIDLFGIVSQNGHSNIIERCIVNSTQGLTTSYSQALVSGIALLGSEQCTKIINNELVNTQAAVGGLSTAYGLVCDSGIEVTSFEASPITINTQAIGRGVTWSPDGRYVIYERDNNSNGGSPRDLRIMEFDAGSDTLTQRVVNATTMVSNAFFLTFDWRDGDYIAYTWTNQSDSRVYVAQFDRNTNSFNANIASSALDSSNAMRHVQWSPNGRFIAVAKEEGLMVFEFDGSSTLTQRANFTNSGMGFSVRWSVDGDYLIWGGSSGTVSAFIRVFAVNSDGSLSEITSSRIANIAGVRGTDFSSDGKYFAVLSNVANSQRLRVYRFNEGVLNQVDGINLSSDPTVNASHQLLQWSSDDNYIAVTGFGTNFMTAQIYAFDRAQEQLILIDGVTVPSSSLFGRSVMSLAWHPNLPYMAFVVTSSVGELLVYNVGLSTAPRNNVLIKNSIYGAAGGSKAIGISDINDANNLIMQNLLYNNPINIQYGPASDVDQIISCIDNPTAITNIAICQPIQTPLDIELMAQQIESKLCDIQLKIDALLP